VFRKRIDVAARAVGVVTRSAMCRRARSVVRNADTVVLRGGPGTGKTHIATVPGVQSFEHHHKLVCCFSIVEIVNALEHKSAQGSAGQISDRLVRSDDVTLNEIGNLPLSASGGTLLFHLLSKHCEPTHLYVI